MQIAKNKFVSFEYTLTDEKGTLIDSSDMNGPMRYIHGHGNILHNLELALEGKSAGEHVQVTLPPDKAYGERNSLLTRVVPRELFETSDIKEGMRVRAPSETPLTEEGRTATVVEVDPDTVTVDLNHPLAGRTLNFDITIGEVRDATKKEIAEGAE